MVKFEYQPSKQLEALKLQALMDGDWVPGDEERYWEHGDESGSYWNAYFPHWVELRPGVVDSQAIAYFMFGACTALALDMHDSSGFELVFLTSAHEHGFVHAGVQTPSGDFIDLEGASVPDDVIARWQRRFPTHQVQYQRFSREDFVELATGGEDNIDEVFSVYERELSKDFALLALSLHA